MGLGDRVAKIGQCIGGNRNRRGSLRRKWTEATGHTAPHADSQRSRYDPIGRMHRKRVTGLRTRDGPE